MRKLDFQSLFLVCAILLAVAAVGYSLLPPANGQPSTRATSSSSDSLSLDQIPFNGQRAYGYLRTLCELGPRPSGSVGMQKQQALLEKHFASLGGQVVKQTFSGRHPETGEAVPMTNLIVRWNPDRLERILLCAHYDTRPFPDNDPDPKRRKGVFVGANDGASGTALLMELAHDMPKLETKYGVDFVLFDAEELVYNSKRDPYFLGSRHFASDYKNNPPGFRYKYGVLLDMVADRNLNIHPEVNSVRWHDTRPLVAEIWRTAEQLGVREFIPKPRHQVDDDHVPLHDIGGIPTCDIIDFDYPSSNMRTTYWHTTRDVPENCSALSLAKVGWVIRTWLTTTP